MSIRIAVVQQRGNPGKLDENRDKAVKFASQSLAQGADVVLFHEELILGNRPDLLHLAEPADGPSTQAFQRVLRNTDSLIIYGLNEKSGDEHFISAPVVSAKGVLANYRKTHLWWKSEGLRHEPSYYQPGECLVTFEVKGHRCGIMICYDGDFPEMTRAYANRGCSVLFWMNNRGSRGHSEVKDLAYRNSMIIAASCCCGPNENEDLCRGGSNITDADGNLLADIWDQEGVIVADVDPAKAMDMRVENPWYRGQRPDIYYCEQDDEGDAVNRAH